MSYMVLDAANLMAAASAGRLEAGGSPEVCHALRVGKLVAGMGAKPEVIIAAILHDAVEDGLLDFEQIVMRYGYEVKSIVDAVSRRKGEPYKEFIERVAAFGPKAVMVKVADLGDNLARIDDLGPERAASLRKRYLGAIDILRRSPAHIS